MTRTHDGFEEEQQQQPEQQFEQPKDGGLSVAQERAMVQVAALDSLDHGRLAQMLIDYPELHDQLIAAASASLGNSCVQAALELYDAAMKDRERRDEGFIDAMIGGETAVAETTAASTEADSDVAFTTAQMENETAVAATTDVSTEVAPAPELAAQVEVVEQMKPGDEQMLAATLEDAPEVRAQVIVEATQSVGAETVEKAIEIQAEDQQAAAPEAAVVQEPISEAAVEQVIEQPKAQQEEEWVGKAREYNERHPELVDEFIQHAGSELRLFDGTVDPTVIVAWQQANGISVDGRIGPETVAAAREGAKKLATVAEEVVAHQDETDAALTPV